MNQKGPRNAGLLSSIQPRGHQMDNSTQQRFNYIIALLAIVLVTVTYHIDKEFIQDSVTIVQHQ